VNKVTCSKITTKEICAVFNLQTVLHSTFPQNKKSSVCMYIWKSNCPSGSRGSVVSLVIKLWTGRLGIRIQGQEIFLVFKTPEPSLGPPVLQFKWYRQLIPEGWNDRGVRLTTHLRLVTLLRATDAALRSSHVPSWRMYQCESWCFTEEVNCKCL
jgi:hypothetical protein